MMIINIVNIGVNIHDNNKNKIDFSFDQRFLP